MTGIALFTGASALCTFAPTLDWLVAARFIQGFGAACIMPLSVALLRFTVPHHRLGMAIGWNALTVALSSAAGPTIGALILSGASRSEEHTSELQSLMRISYAVFCLKKKHQKQQTHTDHDHTPT